VWATRRDKQYLRYLALHFTVQGADLHEWLRHWLAWPSDIAAPGFFVFYNSIFGMFCPLWTGETELGGLRMVRRRAAACADWAGH
jgi:hypothetical protein